MSKNKSRAYTTSELTGHFNIPVVSASRFVVKHKLKPVKTGQHSARYYNGAVSQQMEGYCQNRSKTQEKQTYPATKGTIIEQLKAQIQGRTAMIELLKQQLTVKDEQIVTANKLADQV